MDMRPLTIAKVIDAPQALVWKARVEESHIVQWHYATPGWTTPFAHVDLRVGGTYRIGFASPDGKNDFVLEGTFREIIKPSYLHYSIGEGREVIESFENEEGKTRVTVTFTPESMHTAEFQRADWSAILSHFADYIERLK